VESKIYPSEEADKRPMPKQKRSFRRDVKLGDDETIASRRYLITCTTPPEYVTVKIGRPRLRVRDGLYECAAEISESGRVWVRYLTGSDAFEALQLALIILGTDLKHINEQLGNALRWSDEERADLGLPTYPDFSLRPIMDGPEGEHSSRGTGDVHGR
jgi:hypothetical protein